MRHEFNSHPKVIQPFNSYINLMLNKILSYRSARQTDDGYILYHNLFILHIFRLANPFGSILSHNRLEYKNSHSSVNYCDC